MLKQINKTHAVSDPQAPHELVMLCFVLGTGSQRRVPEAGRGGGHGNSRFCFS